MKIWTNSLTGESVKLTQPSMPSCYLCDKQFDLKESITFMNVIESKNNTIARRSALVHLNCSKFESFFKWIKGHE